MIHNENSVKENKILRLLFETASEGLIVSDHSGSILMCNPRVTEMFGYSREELIGQKIEILLSADLKAIHEKHRDSFFEKPARRTMGIGFDLKAKRKDNTSFPIEVSLNHFTSEGKMFVMALLTDITRRKIAEKQLYDLNEELEKKVTLRTKELQKSQLLYSLIARNFPNGTINVFDRDLNYVFAEGSDLYNQGITSEQLVGTNYIKKLPQEVAKEIEEHLLEAFEGTNQSFEVLLKRGAYQLNVVALHDEKGEIPQILVVEQNITKQKEAEQKIKKSLEKERELSDLKSRFVSMASHEFRTPLSTILSSTSLAAKYIESKQIDNTNKHLKRIKSSVQNLTSILNDFLSLNKLEEDKIKAHFEKFHFSEVIEEVVGEMQELAKEGQKINLEMNLTNKEVILDKVICKNICINLISNAIKYSSEHKTIWIDVTSDETLVLKIKDEGIGIPEQEQKHLFERFFRANNVTNIQGTGLGLNIIKKYIDLLHGSISFESTCGQGTTFIVELPLTHKEHEQNYTDY